jgi:hypothetical protein
VFRQHLTHDFADRTGRADHRNAWDHENSSFRDWGDIAAGGFARRDTISYCPRSQTVRQGERVLQSANP